MRRPKVDYHDKRQPGGAVLSSVLQRSPTISSVLQVKEQPSPTFSSVLQVKEQPSPAFSNVLQRSLAAGSSQKFGSGLMSFQP
ncbi:unnamed protein product [Arctogadus glacialis]